MYVSDVVLTNKNKENTEQKCKMRWESLVLDFWITVLCKLYEPTLRIKIHWQCVCVVVFVLKNESFPNQMLSRCYCIWLKL